MCQKSLSSNAFGNGILLGIFWPCLGNIYESEENKYENEDEGDDHVDAEDVDVDVDVDVDDDDDEDDDAHYDDVDGEADALISPQISYKASLLHLQPRQMRLIVTELKDDMNLQVIIMVLFIMIIMMILWALS